MGSSRLAEIRPADFATRSATRFCTASKLRGRGARCGGPPVTVGAITVTAQATSSPDRHDKQGSGDFYLAISGDLQPVTSGDFYMATDSWCGAELARMYRRSRNSQLQTVERVKLLCGIRLRSTRE